MNNPLAGLIQMQAQHGPPPWKLRDGAIQTTSPLTVLIDGDDDPVTPTKAPLIGGIAVGQRVLLAFVGKDLYIFGRYGG